MDTENKKVYLGNKNKALTKLIRTKHLQKCRSPVSNTDMAVVYKFEGSTRQSAFPHARERLETLLGIE